MLGRILATLVATVLLAACGNGGGSQSALPLAASQTAASATRSTQATLAAAPAATACTPAPTANAGSLRGLAAGCTQSTVCSAPVAPGPGPAPAGLAAAPAPPPGPAGPAAAPAPAAGPAAPVNASSGSLRGLAAGASTCSQANNAGPHTVVQPNGNHVGTPNCPPAGPAAASCDSLVGSAPGAGTSVVNPTTIAGLHPSDLASAYNFSPSSGGTGQRVAIVDAYDDPNAEADLAVYRAEWGLPPCTTANGCFVKTGGGKGPALPPSDPSWASEIALDLDMVSAACPNCSIVLVEAPSSQMSDLAAAVDVAAGYHPNVISNSYYVPETALQPSDIAQDAPHYVHPGIALTVSSGDQSYGPTFPASMPNVFAVGGTTLVPSTVTRGWYETAWHGTGAGCSTFSPKPAWQTDAGCPKRTLVDLAVVADPDTGVAVYDTFGGSGWYVEGGTSVGAPLVAGMIALAGNGAALNGASSVYANASSMWPILSGNDGVCAGSSAGAYLCTALPGYDGPSGNGSPNGLAAL